MAHTRKKTSTTTVDTVIRNKKVEQLKGVNFTIILHSLTVELKHACFTHILPVTDRTAFREQISCPNQFLFSVLVPCSRWSWLPTGFFGGILHVSISNHTGVYCSLHLACVAAHFSYFIT